VLAKLDADMRQELGDETSWLDGAKLIAHDETSTTLRVFNTHQADNVRRHCGATILKITGASRLDFVVERPAAANGRRP
jgi:hypothetical protein